MEAIDELRDFLTSATEDAVWGRLLDRGAAWALMRVDGKLPDDAPPFGDTIDVDLAEHGFEISDAPVRPAPRRGRCRVLRSGRGEDGVR